MLKTGKGEEKIIMNLSEKGALTGEKKLGSAKPILNPNATEFVPFALRSPAAGISISDASCKFVGSAAGPPGKSLLDRSESSISNNSDEEAQQYWRHQLPDDITPDFKVIGVDNNNNNNQEINSLSFSSLSMNDVDERSRSKQLGSSPHPLNGDNYADKQRYAVSSYGKYPSPTGFQPKPWDKQIVNNDNLFARERYPYRNGNSRVNVLDDLPNEHLLMDNEDVSPLEFLASQFPGLAAESLMEVYFANGGDLNLAIEMLTRLELQLQAEHHGGLTQTLNSKALSTPNLRALDFPVLSVSNGQNGFGQFAGHDHQSVSPYRSPEKDSALLFRSYSSIPSRGATDFASAVKKMACQDSNIWKFDKKGSSDTSIGSSRSSQVMGSLYNGGQGKGIYGNMLQNQGPARASSVWLETGEGVANMYSEMREEARDHAHARARNAYFDQARQAYLIGNTALAKELSIKGQMHYMQMKAAHGKAQDSIFRQRNTYTQANPRERIIDLHGLHVSEALHVLKRELTILRNVARSADQRLLAYICVGTGHHTRGPQTPAIERYLLEEEGLDYSEPQPGLLRVMLF